MSGSNENCIVTIELLNKHFLSLQMHNVKLTCQKSKIVLRWLSSFFETASFATSNTPVLVLRETHANWSDFFKELIARKNLTNNEIKPNKGRNMPWPVPYQQNGDNVVSKNHCTFSDAEMRPVHCLGQLWLMSMVCNFGIRNAWHSQKALNDLSLFFQLKVIEITHREELQLRWTFHHNKTSLACDNHDQKQKMTTNLSQWFNCLSWPCFKASAQTN